MGEWSSRLRINKNKQAPARACSRGAGRYHAGYGGPRQTSEIRCCAVGATFSHSFEAADPLLQGLAGLGTFPLLRSRGGAWRWRMGR